ncbi:fibronectin type III domain-containing protein [Candidatus Latescibacterota bacterium]
MPRCFLLGMFLLISLLSSFIISCDRDSSTGLNTLLPPSDLSAIASNPREITLTWKDNSKGESGFILELKEDTNEFALIDTVASNSKSYIISGLKEFYYYTVRIKTFNAVLESDFSNEITIMAEPIYPVLYVIYNVSAKTQSGMGRFGNGTGTIHLYKNMVQINCNYTYTENSRISEREIIETVELPNNNIYLLSHGKTIQYLKMGLGVSAKRQ